MTIRINAKNNDFLIDSKPASRKIKPDNKLKCEDINIDSGSRKISPKNQTEVMEDKPSRSIFWRVYKIFVTISVIMIVSLWAVLWSFLNAYEKSQVEHRMEEIIQSLDKEDISVIMDNAKIQVSAFESEDKVYEFIKSRMIKKDSDTHWTFSKKLERYTKSEPVFQLKLGEEKIAVITFSIDEKREIFNTPRWNIKEVSLCIVPEYGRNITVPKGSEVSVNKIKLSDESITATNVKNNNLGNVTKYIEEPTMITYSVDKLYFEPEIKVTGPVYRSELQIDETIEKTTDDGYETDVYGFESYSDLTKNVESRIKTITQKYGLYVTGDEKFSGLSRYILSDSYAYSYLSKISSTNKWVGAHTKPTFSEMKVFNYQSYTENCFSCEVTFIQSLTSGGVVHNYPTHIKYVFIKKNNDWYVADIVIKRN